MSYTEVLKTEGSYRVVIIADDDPFAPEGDLEPPLLRIDHGQPSFAREDGEHGDVVLTAFQRWCVRPNDRGWPLFEKYMRAFMGATVIQPWLSENGNWYVAYDTPAWRERSGLAGDPNWRANIAGQDLIGDWKAYTNGDVWGYRVEKCVAWEDKAGDYADRGSWEEVLDDCAHWGYYGREGIEADALADLADYAEDDHALAHKLADQMNETEAIPGID